MRTIRIRSGQLFVAQLALVVAFCLSCGSGPNQRPNAPAKQEQGSRGGTASYRLSSPPTSFNYVMAADESTVMTAFFLLSSRLVDFDWRTQKFVPALAESWKTADNGTTVDVKLREGIKFSDGTEITSDDVVFTLRAIYDERTHSPAWRDSMLVGKKPIEATAIDKGNIRFVFPEKVAAVENYLSNIGVLPSSKLKAELDAGKFAGSWKIDSDLGGIVTSGPFVVASASAGERVELRRNPNYWKRDKGGTQLPYLDGLQLEVVADPNNALARLNQNTLDIIDRIRPSDYAAINSAPGTVKAADVGPGLTTDHLWFNLNDAKADGTRLDNAPKFAWFHDKRFRQAVSAAIDRNSITATSLRGLATPLYGFVSPGNRVWADPNVPKTVYDLQRAAQLLADAGFIKRGTDAAPELYDAGGNRVEFTLIVPAENEPRKLMAAVIQEDLARLGIRMQVAPIEFQQVTERWTKSLDYDAVLLGLSITDLEPSSYANFLVSGAAAHQWQPSQKTPASDWEKRIDQLFDEQARETDQQKRIAAFNQIQAIMADEMPVIPIAARHVLSAANARLGNYIPTPVMPYSLWNADELFIRPQ